MINGHYKVNEATALLHKTRDQPRRKLQMPQFSCETLSANDERLHSEDPVFRVD